MISPPVNPGQDKEDTNGETKEVQSEAWICTGVTSTFGLFQSNFHF